MNAKQESKLKMYLTLRIFLLSNAAITATIPNSSELLAALDAAILQIQTYGEEQQFNSSGIAGNKKQLREKLVTTTADSSRKLQAYAIYSKDTVLQAETKYTLTQLKEVSEVKLINIVSGLHTRIDSNLPALAPYLLTQATQADFQADITAFADAIPEQSQSELEKKESKRLQDQGFDDANVTAVRLDAMIEIVRESEQGFYTGYKAARKTHDMGKGSLQVQGTITEAATGKTIAYATVTFRLQGQTEIIFEKETAVKGGFNVKNLTEGIYDITATKVGFKPETITTVVRWDELCVVEIKMKKI